MQVKLLSSIFPCQLNIFLNLKQNEMLDKLQEKNKLWGLVLGRVIQAKLEKEEVPSPVS